MTRRDLVALRRALAAVVGFVVVFQAGAIAPASSLAAEAPPPTASASSVTATASGPTAPPVVVHELASRQELPEQRTIDSRTFANPDGTFTTESFPTAIHYDDGSGTLVPIDTTPKPSARSGVAFETTSAPARAELGASSASGTLLRVVNGQQSIALRPIVPPGMTGLAAAADRAPVLDAGRVLYRDVYPSTDLRYNLLPDGAKEDIVLKSASAPATFAFAIDAPGLTARLEPDGSISLGDAKTQAFRIPAPFMVDSAAEKDGDGVRSNKVSYSLVTVGGQQVVLVSADPTWLADPARVFPVYLDPTTLSYATTLDTFITSAYPTSSHDAYWNPNEGGYYELWNGYYDATSGTNYAYVKTSLPSGVTVLSATFNIYVQHSYMGATPTGIYLGKLTSAFTSGQTWNMTQPSWTAYTSDTVADNQWATFTVTSLVSDWIYGAATNYGVRIYESSNAQSLWKRLRASENSTNTPYTSITWTRPSNTPTSPIGGAWGKGTFSWTYADNGSGLPQARYWVQVATSSAFSTILADSTPSSGSTTSWTAPTANLVNGTTYYWRVSVGDGHSWSGWSAAQTWKFDGTPPSFSSVTIGGAVTAADPNYYFAGTGTATVKIRGSDAHSGIKFTDQRLYAAADEDRAYHDWSVGGTNCTEVDTSTLVDVTACAETYNAGGVREVQFSDVGLNADATLDLHYSFTDLAGNTLGYVDSGKRLIFDATPPTGAITSPAAGATVAGSVPIVGSASDTNFTQYVLDYGAGSAPTSWTTIGTYTSQVTNATLGSWDASSLATGQYTVRLRVYDKARVSAGYTTVTRTLTVDNNAPTAILSAPVANDLLDGAYPVLGTASAPADFAGYSLEVGAGCTPGSWTSIVSAGSPVSNGRLGVWDTTGLAGSYALKLTSTRSGGQSASATVCVTVGAGLGRQRQHSFEAWDLGGGDGLAVNVATGNPLLTHPLVSLPYRGGDSLELALTYNGQDATNAGIGPGWQLSVGRRLVLNADGSVTFVDADGARHTFTNPVTNGTVTTYTRPATLYATLVKDTAQADEFSLTYRDLSLDRFDLAGSVARLSRSQDRHANGITFAYDANGDLASATDPAGRQVSFAWNPATSPHSLTSLSDWAWIDAAGVVQATASGSRRTYRFFYDAGGQLSGWADPLNVSGSCPTGGSHLTCLTYAAGQLTAISKTQTVTTLAGGALGTATRTLVTAIAYAGNRVAAVTDAEQQAAGASGQSTIFTLESATRIRVDRPTTATAYGLLAAGDPYARVQSVWRSVDTTQIERRTTWDAAFLTEPASVTDNYGALLGTPARTVSYSYQPGSLGLLSRLVEPLTATTNRWTDYVYNVNHDVTAKTVSQDGSAQLTTTTRSCYDAGCSLTGTGLDRLAQIDNYVDGVAPDEQTNVRVDYAYDAYGQLIRVTRRNRNAAGAVLDDRVDAFTYDANGNQTAAIVNYVDGLVTGGDDLTPNATTLARTDLTTSFGYDTAGNRVSSADPRRAIAAAGGSPGPDDYVTRWTYDAVNQQLSEQAPVTPGGPTPPVRSSVYDELGLARTATDFAGTVTAAGFDRVARALTGYQRPPGQSARQTSDATFDADGRQLTARDERQLADANLGYTENGYDGLGRLTSTTQGAGGASPATTASTYDALDRRISYAVAGQATTYAYDLAGRTVSTDDGFTCTTELFDYRDQATQTIKGKDGNGCAGTGWTISHAIDALGRSVADTTGSDRTRDEVLDAVGNRLSTASAATDSNGTTRSTSVSYTRNLLDQAVAEVRDDGSTTKTSYDPAGNPTDVCRWESGAPVGACLPVGTTPWPDAPAHATSAAHDARNQRISLADSVTQATTVYDPAHNYQVAAVYVPTGAGRELQTLYAYDGRQRLTGITIQSCAALDHACSDTPLTLGSDSYEYDANDNRSRVVESRDGTPSTTLDARYCYDARNQLIFRNSGAACGPSANDERYTYDDAGNRLTATDAAGTTTFAYSPDGQLTTVTPPNSGQAWTAQYHTDGVPYEWEGWHIWSSDAAGRPTEVCDNVCSTGSTKLYFVYDGEGRRVRSTVVAGGIAHETEFRYVGDAISAEYLDGVLVRSYLTDSEGAIVKMVIPAGQAEAGTYLVTWNGHGDALNLARVEADGSLTLANSYSYASWGQPTTSTHNGIADLGFRFLYVGREGVQWDAEIGLYYMRARTYDPKVGRFLQPDPEAAEENLYAYAENGPVTKTDPDGTVVKQSYNGIAGRNFNHRYRIDWKRLSREWARYRSKAEKGRQIAAAAARAAAELRRQQARRRTGACVAVLIASDGASVVALGLEASGLALQGASVAAFGLTAGTGAPVTVGGVITGAVLEIIGAAIEVGAGFAIMKACG